MKTHFISLLVLITFEGWAQTAPPILTQKSLGGSSDDVACFIQQTIDGGCVVAGYSNSNDGHVSGNHGFYDSWIVKLNKNNNIQWQKPLGGSWDDRANCIDQTSDSGFIVAGYSGSNDSDLSANHGIIDYWVVKLNKDGNIQWQKSFGGSNADWASSVQQTSDGGYIVAGNSYSRDGDVSGNHGVYDYWILKLDSKGDIRWQKSLGGSSYDYAYSIQQTFDKGFIVAGVSESDDGDVSGNHGGNGYDYWIVKLNSKGNIVWQKSLGGTDDDQAKSIRQTSDSGFVVAGHSRSKDGDVINNHGNSDYWIVKLRKNGDIEWQKSLGGSGSDEATSIKQTFNEGFIIAGTSDSNDGDVSGNHGGNSDYWIVRMNKPGNTIRWQRSLGGSDPDVPTCIQQLSDSSYMIAGSSNSRNGDVIGHHGTKLSTDCWIVKLKDTTTTFASASSDLVAEALIEKIVKEADKDFTAYPNPAKDILYIQTTGSGIFSLIGPLGKILITKNITGHSSIDVGTLPPGMYYLKNNTTGRLQKIMIGR